MRVHPDPCSFQLKTSVFLEIHPVVAKLTEATVGQLRTPVGKSELIAALLGDAQAIVTRLDAAIQNKYSRDPDKLTAWKSASRVERAAKKAKTPEGTLPPAR